MSGIEGGITLHHVPCCEFMMPEFNQHISVLLLPTHYLHVFFSFSFASAEQKCWQSFSFACVPPVSMHYETISLLVRYIFVYIGKAVRYLLSVRVILFSLMKKK